MNPWINIQPTANMQNFINCYGIINLEDTYYTITDLVEDDVQLPSQRINEFKDPKNQHKLVLGPNY